LPTVLPELSGMFSPVPGWRGSGTIKTHGCLRRRCEGARHSPAYGRNNRPTQWRGHSSRSNARPSVAYFQSAFQDASTHGLPRACWSVCFQRRRRYAIARLWHWSAVGAVDPHRRWAFQRSVWRPERCGAPLEYIHESFAGCARV
jgi:hypothetical protein